MAKQTNHAYVTLLTFSEEALTLSPLILNPCFTLSKEMYYLPELNITLPNFSKINFSLPLYSGYSALFNKFTTVVDSCDF